MSAHTSYQPSDKEWKCPKCGASHESEGIAGNEFTIYESAGCGDDECLLLHVDDWLQCSCGYCCKGESFARRLKRKASMVPCPCCKQQVKKEVVDAYLGKTKESESNPAGAVKQPRRRDA